MIYEITERVDKEFVIIFPSGKRLIVSRLDPDEFEYLIDVFKSYEVTHRCV